VLTEDVPSPQNQNIASRSWSITSGTAIGGYTASTSSGSVVALPSSNAASYTFYWIYPGSSLTVAYSYTLTNGQTSPAVTATFNVVGPSVTSMNTPTGSVAIFAGPSLAYGPIGIEFNPMRTTPQGDSGQFEWVQLISNDTLTFTTVSGTNETCVNVTQPSTPSGTGLDTEYPYAKGTSTQDSPTIGLVSSQYQKEGRSFSAQMYLMWDPALPAGCSEGTNCTSIPVPLGSVAWGWSGTAAYAGGSWTLTSSGASTPSWNPGSSYPTWSDYVPYSGQIACQ